MSRTRGEANQALYRARILLEAWDRMRSEARHTESALIDGFLPAVRMHLLEAYGWFLLAVSGVEEASSLTLPANTGDLPRPDAGKALSPEIAEFTQLEKTGWLAQMLEDTSGAGPSPGAQSSVQSVQGLLVSDREVAGFAVVMAWADALSATMTRMDDSLSEC
ncbi:hypothetical protein [Congregibacter sp.]|uniref:hypothetical protein n=1 Tax=Congregibacter sp. TaxID=2744308 RepID=UPI003F6D84D0